MIGKSKISARGRSASGGKKQKSKVAEVKHSKAAATERSAEQGKQEKMGREASGVAEVAEPKTARAVGRYLKISPTKVRGVLDLIRGKSVKEARRVLRFSPKKGARFSLKVLDSAVANAGSVDEEGWVVFDARANKGPFFRKKRDPKARGSWGMITTPSTHLTIVIKESNVSDANKVNKVSNKAKRKK